MGAMERRQALHRTFAAAIAVASVLAISGCGDGEGPPVLTWYTNPDDGGQASFAEECTAAANGAYSIDTSMLPNDAASQREQLIRRLASSDSSIDIMSLDPVFVAEMAQAEYLAPVPEALHGEFTEGVNEASITSSTWKDQLVAAPFWANTQILWYRKSAADAAGLDMSKPVTWDQLIEAAKSQEKEISVHGIKAEALTVWVNALVESGGGQIVENPEAEAEDVKFGLDTPAGSKAAEILSTIGQEGLAGPSFSNLDENGAMLRFQQDTGGFMVNWPFVYAATKAATDDGSLDPAVLEDIGWTIYPATEEGMDSAPPLGGINLAVGAFSENQELAFEAIECIRTEEHQSSYFVSDGLPPASLAAFDSPDVAENVPMADVIKESLEQAAARPQSPYYNEITGGIQDSWHPPGSVDPETTPAASAALITEILKGERLL